MRYAILIYNREVVSGSNRWRFTGLLGNGHLLIDELHGDINKVEELAAALREFFLSKPRYARHMETPDETPVRDRNLH